MSNRPTRGRQGAPSGSLIPSLVVLGIGGLLVAFGIAYQAATASGGHQPSLTDNIIGGVTLAIGGGAIGAAIQTITERRYDGDALSNVEQMIRESLGARFTSDDDALSMFRRDWHHYYLTHVDGESAWWHQTYSFGRNLAKGSITERTSVLDSGGKAHGYLTEAGIRGQRFMLIETREGGGEPALVEIYPMPRGFATVHVAVAFLEGWDSVHLVTKAILSEQPLLENDVHGAVPRENWPALDAVWKSHFLAQNKLTLDDIVTPAAPGT